ncbi:MAG: TolC family protein [Parachlamydia sp.]|nr:TolC family protein [Parachlamydia sp.]
MTRFVLTYMLALCGSLSGVIFTLEQAESYAMDNNKHILALEELANASREQYFEIIARWLPQAQFQGEYDKSEIKVALLPGLRPQSEFWTTGFHFNQLLLSKQLYHQIKAGKWDSHRVKLEAINLKNEILFEVRTAYWFVVLAREEVEVQKVNMKLLKEALDEEDKRLKSGKATAFNVNQSKVSLANAHTDYYTSVRDLKSAHNHLLRVLGMGPECTDEVEAADQDISIQEFWMLADKLNLLGWDKAQDNISLPKTEEHLFTCEEKRYWQELALDNNPNILIQDSDVGFHR